MPLKIKGRCIKMVDKIINMENNRTLEVYNNSKDYYVKNQCGDIICYWYKLSSKIYVVESYLYDSMEFLVFAKLTGNNGALIVPKKEIKH